MAAKAAIGLKGLTAENYSEQSIYVQVKSCH